MFSVDQYRLARNNKTAYVVVLFRWLVSVIILILYFFGSQSTASKAAFLQTLAVAAVHNFIITLIVKKKEIGRKGNYLIICIDIVLVSIFCYELSGINSDIYIIYFFLISHSGIYGSPANVMRISMLALISYSLACIFYAKGSPEEFSYARLITKDIMILFAAYAVSLISHEIRRYNELHRKEFKLARVDKLTGLANRHYFEQKLKEEVDYVSSSGNPLNVLIFDLDNFKKFNDAYGHVWGDKLLVLFSDIIRNNIRKNDIPVRYGGEEFLILIRDLDIVIARSVGERIRRQLEKQGITVENQQRKTIVTASCGIAQYPTHSGDIKRVIDYADKALYFAKGTGKNRVVCYDEIGELAKYSE